MQYNETMLMLLLLIAFVIVLLAGTRPVNLELSEYEVRKRERSGNLSRLDADRAKYADVVAMFLRAKIAILLIIFALISVYAFGWTVGLIMSVVLALFYQWLGQLGFIGKIADKLYGYYERYLLKLCAKLSGLPGFNSTASKKESSKLYSKSELLSILKSSPNVLSKSEAKLVKGALSFESKVVKDIMTPQDAVSSVTHDELLGPITLNELHETGYDNFPVIDGGVDQVVGVLHIRDMLVVDGNRKTPKVSEVMDKDVCYINQNQVLTEALAVLVKSNKPLAMVVDSSSKIVGLLSLGDIVESLMGRKLEYETDGHFDIQEVAGRKSSRAGS